MMEYYPKQYLTIELLHDILSQYELDVPFTLEEDLPDGIVVNFPNSSFYVSEYGEGEVLISFLASQIGTKRDLSLADAMSVIVPNVKMFDEYPIKKHIPFASEEKVRNQLKNYFHLITKYMRPFLLGDKSWVNSIME